MLCNVEEEKEKQQKKKKKKMLVVDILPTNQWPQAMGERLTPMPGNNSHNNNNNNNSPIKASATGNSASAGAAAAAAGGASGAAAAAAAAAPPPPLKCPRCDSANTKFCYYNNYSLSQPRHFCKACKRYWTRGGTLRNVPVGGGCRKNKRPKRQSSHVAAAAAADRITGLVPVAGPMGPGPVPLLPPLSHLDLSSINPLLFASSSSMNLPLIPNLQGSTAARIPIDLQPHVEFQLRGSGGDEFPLGQIQQPGLAAAEFPLLGHSLLPNSIASFLELNGSVGIVKNERMMESAAAAAAAAASNNNDRGEWLTPCESSFESAGASNLALNPTDLSYFYWNSGIIGGSGGGGWADAANCGPSIAPLL